MYIILTYDVKEKRVRKMMKICRKYLIHTQESVFEGDITETQIRKLKEEIYKIANCSEDSICMYSVSSLSLVNKEQLGIIREHSFIL